MCPAPMTVVSATGSPVPVSYPAPAASGGVGLTTSCTPASGSPFAAGTTAVSCSAVVADERVGCTFNVTVAPAPRIDATKFLAFGDSITYGSTGSACSGPSIDWRSPAAVAQDRLWLSLNAVGPGQSYPSVLQTMLGNRYSAQTPAVENEGLPGDSVIAPIDSRRFVNALNRHSPDVLLLQEGINDLHGFGFLGLSPGQGIALTVSGLRSMIREAKRRGVQVFIGTLLPQRPNHCRAFAIPPKADQDLISPTNDQIRGLAAAEGAELVDLHEALNGSVDVLIGFDGLHPTEAGYGVIAKTFLAAIQRKLENPPPPTVAGLARP